MITTERLLLRPLRVDDVDDLFEYQSDADTVRYIPWPQRTREQVLEALQTHAANAVQRPVHDGAFALLAWSLRADGKVIGQGNLAIESELHRHASIGWVTHPAHIRHGYALEATRALIDWAFGELGLHRITATVDTRNEASARLAERLGMRLEATHVDDEWFKGAWTSTWVYALLDREWRGPGA
jgi:aminoglycoside 6'-N-acetyltransferase